MKSYGIAMSMAIILLIGCDEEPDNVSPNGSGGAGEGAPTAQSSTCSDPPVGVSSSSSGESGAGGDGGSGDPTECQDTYKPPIFVFAPNPEGHRCFETFLIPCAKGGRGIVCDDGGSSLQQVCSPGAGFCLPYSGTTVTDNDNNVVLCCNICVMP